MCLFKPYNNSILLLLYKSSDVFGGLKRKQIRRKYFFNVKKFVFHNIYVFLNVSLIFEE